jgi:hypothetical protein
MVKAFGIAHRHKGRFLRRCQLTSISEDSTRKRSREHDEGEPSKSTRSEQDCNNKAAATNDQQGPITRSRSRKANRSNETILNDARAKSDNEYNLRSKTKLVQNSSEQADVRAHDPSQQRARASSPRDLPSLKNKDETSNPKKIQAIDFAHNPPQLGLLRPDLEEVPQRLRRS